MTYTFAVEGLPAPQGSKSIVVDPRTGTTRLVEGKGATGRQRTKAWRSAVTLEAAAVARTLRAPRGPLDGPLALDVLFRLPMPPSRPKKIRDAGHAWHTVKPDASKLLRATEDALTDAGLIRDDARIADTHLRKIETTGWVGAVITISKLTADPEDRWPTPPLWRGEAREP